MQAPNAGSANAGSANYNPGDRIIRSVILYLACASNITCMLMFLL